MIFYGQNAIKHLAGEIQREDPAASSHWKKYHASFNFNGESFTGLQGFGEISKPYTGIKALLHKFLQKKYRRYGDNLPAFKAVEESAKAITGKQDRAFDLDVLRQVLTASFLKKNIPEKLNSDKTILVIGDGLASMTSILLANQFAGTVILINLNKTLLVDLWYLKLWMGTQDFEAKVALVDEAGDAQAFLTSGNSKRVVAIQASNYKLIHQFKIDVAINIVSMQEMDLEAIDGYFKELHQVSVVKELAFYCCNREEKVLPDGTVTRIAEYPWKITDKILVDELCPWHQHYYRLKPPFRHFYDGPIRHQIRNFEN